MFFETSTYSTNSVFVEVSVYHQKLDKTFNVRLLPLEITQRVIGAPHIGFEEKRAGVFKGPVLRDLIFLLGVISDELDDTIQVFVFAN